MARTFPRWIKLSVATLAILLTLTVFAANKACAQTTHYQPWLGLPSPLANPGAWQRPIRPDYIPAPPVQPWSHVDPYGNSTTIQPSVFNPGANVVIPGSSTSFGRYIPGVGYVGGTQYLGADGLPHGQTTIIDPAGRKHINVYAPNPHR